MKLIVRTHFDAAHKLNNYDGPCANVHGHTWHVDVELGVPNPPEGGFYDEVTVDFKLVKALINACLPDHKYINDVASFNPTAENIALYLQALMTAQLVKNNLWDVTVGSVTVWESEDCGAKVEA